MFTTSNNIINNSQKNKNSPKRRYYRKKSTPPLAQNSVSLDTQQEDTITPTATSTIKRRRKKKKPTANPTIIPNQEVSKEQAIDKVVVKEQENVPIKQETIDTMKPTVSLSKDYPVVERDARRTSKQKTHDESRHLESPPVNLNKPILQAGLPVTKNTDENKSTEKSREDILAEREAKKLAKLAAKNKTKGPSDNVPSPKPASIEKATEKIVTTAKLATTVVDTVVVTKQLNNLNIPAKDEKPTLSKAERRAKQEAQRAVKASVQAVKTPSALTTAKPKIADTKIEVQAKPIKKVLSVAAKTTQHRVKLFNHLYADRELPENILNSVNIHPSVIKLGAQYANRIVVGSNARCIAFMNTMKMVNNIRNHFFNIVN